MADSPVEIRWKKSQNRTFRTPRKCGSFHFVGEDKSSRYSMGEVLATTKQSEVYLAYDTKHNNRKVIIKKPSQDGIFKSEVAALSKLHDHDHIVCLLDFYSVQTQKILVYEYVKGEDLIDWVNHYYETSHSVSDIENTMKPIAQQLLDALLFCHQNGVAHRDVKLDNIRINLVTNNIKLLDFGFAYVENSNMNDELRCGSVDYAAPELISPDIWDIVNPYKSDVWSYGVVVYILTHYQIPYYCHKGTYILDEPETRFSLELRELIHHTLQEDLSLRSDLQDIKSLEWF